jgi:preprotein translocase subunit SecE
VELANRLYAPKLRGRSKLDGEGHRCRGATGFPDNQIKARQKLGKQGLGHPGALNKERQMASKTTNPFTFLQQVRQETAKVTWPSRRETVISTVMVLAFAFLAAIFFFAADQVMAWAVELILGIGR